MLVTGAPEAFWEGKIWTAFSKFKSMIYILFFDDTKALAKPVLTVK